MTSQHDICWICLKSLTKSGLGRQALPCGHVMHENCLTEMRRNGASCVCPMCRESHQELTSVRELIDRSCVCGLRKQFDESFRLASEAHDLDPGNEIALGLLGLAYKNGLGVRKDRARAAELLQEAAQLGNLESVFHLGIIKRDFGRFEEAFELFNEAHQKGEKSAAIEAGGMLVKLGKCDAARKLWNEAWQEGNLEAGFNLGVLHQQKEEMLEAKIMYEKLHALGHVGATNNLALIFQMEGDIESGKSLLEEAHGKGDAEATYNLGALLENEARCELDILKSLRGEFPEAYARVYDLFEQAAKKGHPAAMTGLAGHLSMRDRVPEAIEWLKQAAALGYEEAKDELKFKSVVWSQCGVLDGDECAKISEVAETPTQFSIGDFVMVQGLQTCRGLGFNGLSGVIIEQIDHSGRFGVLLQSLNERISLKPENLAHQQVYDPEKHAVNSAANAGVDEKCEESEHDEHSVNAKISDMLVRSREASRRVTLLKFSRRPKDFRNLLMEAPELSECRLALESHGFPVELESGAKMFVKPEDYMAAKRALSLQHIRLTRMNVVSDPSLENTICSLVGKLPSHLNVYPKGAYTVPLGLAAATVDQSRDISVTRTFIHINVPASSFSANVSGVRTMSTTDAHPREGKNPRPERGTAPSAVLILEKWLPKVRWVAKTIGQPSCLVNGLCDNIMFSSRVDELGLWKEQGFFQTLRAVGRLMRVKQSLAPADGTDYYALYGDLMWYIEQLFLLSEKHGGLDLVESAEGGTICDDIERQLLKPAMAKALPNFPYMTPRTVREHGRRGRVLLWSAKIRFHDSRFWQNLVEFSAADLEPQFESPSENLEPECAYCQTFLTLATMKRCAQCHTAVYCSRRCQKMHWKEHKKQCE